MNESIILSDVRTFNWGGAIMGMRNPLCSWSNSDSDFSGEFPALGENDLELALKLIRAGSDHRKFLRQIFISFNLTAPEYFWKQYATYKIGTTENSTSQMHTLGNECLSGIHFSPLHQGSDLELIIMILNKMIVEYRTTKDKGLWLQILSTIPQSFLYLKSCTMNYEVLRNMYHSRKDHKLQEWREFTKQILDETPYPEFITTIGGIK